MDDVEWDVAVSDLDKARDDLVLLGRLLDQTGALRSWRDEGDALTGALAADALDQALGLLEELAHGQAEQLLMNVRNLRADLPRSAD